MNLRQYQNQIKTEGSQLSSSQLLTDVRHLLKNSIALLHVTKYRQSHLIIASIDY